MFKSQRKNILYSLGLNALLILILVVAYKTYMGNLYQKAEEYFIEHQERRSSHFKTLSNRNQEIIFLGDDWIEEGAWAELFQNANIINRGIIGDNTAGVLARVQEVSESQPQKVFIMIGGNDIVEEVPESDIVKNYRQIITEIAVQSPESEIYLHSVLPFQMHLGRKVQKSQEIEALNKKIAALAAEFKAEYLDISPEFKIKDKLNKELSNDGKHLKGAGYQLWKKSIEKYVQKPEKKTLFLLDEKEDSPKKAKEKPKEKLKKPKADSIQSSK